MAVLRRLALSLVVTIIPIAFLVGFAWLFANYPAYVGGAIFIGTVWMIVHVCMFGDGL